MKKETISTNNAPSAIGPYSQAVKANGFLFVSGQIPIDPKTSQLAGDTIEIQTKQCLENIKAIVNEAKLELINVVKVNIFLKDMNCFNTVNEIYGTYFAEFQPARAAVEVSRLPKDVLIEIECIAVCE